MDACKKRKKNKQKFNKYSCNNLDEVLLKAFGSRTENVNPNVFINIHLQKTQSQLFEVIRNKSSASEQQCPVISFPMELCKHHPIIHHRTHLRTLTSFLGFKP
jgi:hypothetical protein